LEVLDRASASRSPLIVTQGSARAVLRRPGSLSDWQLRAVARTGGVVGIHFDREAIGGGRDASVADLIRHIEHVERVAGPEAVALSSGFETGIIPPSGLGSAARFPRLADALMRTGMSRAALRALFYQNAARVLCGPRAASGAR
jgi:membrane dipeptidase